MVTSRFTNSNILRVYIADAQISPIYLCLSYFDIISITVELEELTKKGDFKEALLSVNDVIRNVVRTEELVELLVIYHFEPNRNRTETEPKQLVLINQANFPFSFPVQAIFILLVAN